MKDFSPEGLGNTMTALGLRAAFIVAGFAGGVSSLWFYNGISRKQAVLAVFISMACATYGTPFLLSVFSIKDLNAAYFAAYAVGLSALNIVPLIRLVLTKMIATKADTALPGSTTTQGEGGKTP